MFTINDTKAKFATFSDAAACAIVHARQRGEAIVRYTNGIGVASFMPCGNQVSIAGMGNDGTKFVLEWIGE